MRTRGPWEHGWGGKMGYDLGMRVWLWVLVVLILVAGLGWGWSVLGDLPSSGDIAGHLNQPSIRITDRAGRALYEVLPEVGGRHAVVELGNMPACMRQATIAVEDKNFYSNPGVDVVGMVRALWINLRGGETVAGGSTITQQVARSLLLKDEMSQRTVRRKLREMALAWELTQAYSKDDILALYLNQTFYGGFAYGVEAAARTYFGKSSSELLTAECALLAGLPQAPALYNPFEYPEAARERQLVVLGLMEKDGFINAAERLEAEQTPLSYNAMPFPIRAPHFVWMVKNKLDQLMADGMLDGQASLVVRTSLDLDAQVTAEAAVARQIAKFKDDKGLDHNVKNAAVVVMDARTGEILAMVGSADYFDASIFGAVNMATAARQPGSVFKPFVYAEALNPENEKAWTAATPILDVQTIFKTKDGQAYIPRNYDDLEHGLVPVRVALASSLNIPAVATLEKVGVKRVAELARQLGIRSLGNAEDLDLSLALGGGGMSLLELTNAYAALANGGVLPERKAILDIMDADGKPLWQAEPKPQTRVFDERVAWLISDILSDDNARQIGFGKNSTLKIERPAAVKTGTTSNYHDNWTIGYTPSLVVGVWVGNSDYQAMHSVNGLTGAAPIWQETMRALLRGKAEEPFHRPDGLVQAKVCAFSGLLDNGLCDRAGLEWFIEGSEPRQADNVYKQVWLDAATGGLASETTAAGNRQLATVLDLPAKAQRWAHSQGLRLLSDYSVTGETGSSLTLISPITGANYHITNKMAAESQQIPVEAVVGPGLSEIRILMDGVILERFGQGPYVIWWKLVEGRHTFWAEANRADGSLVRSEVVELTVTR